MISAFVRYLSALFGGRSQVDSEIKEELRSHVQHRSDDLERSGLSRTEAERRARIDLGSYEKFRAECQEAHGGQGLETFWQDARFGVRRLSKSPGFTATAVVTLALESGPMQSPSA